MIASEHPPPPDVTIIVPVYNAMPYLTTCLDSLVGQTIDHARMHVVAVNDGSTDGSDRELERYAAAHPGLFTVHHQANSGGPARPCNVGLDLARVATSSSSVPTTISATRRQHEWSPTPTLGAVTCYASR